MQVLLVEDDATVSTLPGKALREEGDSVWLAGSGSAGLELAEIGGVRCHCAGCNAAGSRRIQCGLSFARRG